MRNCKICMEPQHCDCLCHTCSMARFALGKTEQMRKYAEAHGFDVDFVDLKMNPEVKVSMEEFIIRWTKL